MSWSFVNFRTKWLQPTLYGTNLTQCVQLYINCTEILHPYKVLWLFTYTIYYSKYVFAVYFFMYQSVLYKTVYQNQRENSKILFHHPIRIGKLGLHAVMVLTRRRQIGKWNCKVGGWRKYGIQCKGCKCSCDGVSPLEALKRMRGAQKGPKKRRSQAKQKSRDTMIVRDPMLEKWLRKCWVGSEIDDKSEFAPTHSVIRTGLSFESAIYNTSNVTNTANGSGNKESTE